MWPASRALPRSTLTKKLLVIGSINATVVYVQTTIHVPYQNLNLTAYLQQAE